MYPEDWISVAGICLTLLMVAVKTVVKLAKLIESTRVPELPPCVNFIGGEVLPHPRDPRWVKADKSYRFGSTIEVQEYAVLGLVGSSVVHLGEAAAAGRFFRAIQDAQMEFTVTLARQRIRGIVMGPSLPDEVWEALEQRFPDPDVPRRIAMP